MFIDDFLPNPMAERQYALTCEFKTHEHNGVNYRGISLLEDDATVRRLEELCEQKFPHATAMYRRYLADEENETYIHSDVLIGAYTAILFLSLPQQCRGGLAFWKHKKHGFDGFVDGHSDKFWDSVYEDGFHESRWTMTELIPMKFNRLVIFPSHRFHSRWPMQAFGTELSNSRLIKVFFLK